MKIKFILFLLVVAVLSVGPVKAADYGSSSPVTNNTTDAPVCGDSKPAHAPILYEPNHPALPKAKKAGEIRLQWAKVPGATGYNVYFGLSPRNYIFSAPNLGDTDNFTVGFLANRTYYFAVQARKGCASGLLSNEWAGRPGGGGVLTRAPGFSPVRPVANTSAVGEQPQQTQQVEAVPTQQQQPKYKPVTVPVKTQAATQSKGFFESIASFFSGLFKR